MIIQQKIYQELNSCRAIYRLIHSEEFMNCYNKSTDEEKKYIDSLVVAKNKVAVSAWIKTQTESYNIRELQLKAKQLNITNWSRFSKEELANRISNKVSSN